MATPGEEEYQSALEQLTQALKERADHIKEMLETERESKRLEEEAIKERSKALGFDPVKNEFSSVASNAQNTAQKFKDFTTQFGKANPAGKISMVADVAVKVAKGLDDFREKVYETQRKLGTTFATATDKLVAAQVQSVASYFTTGPTVSSTEIIDSINAYQKEFGTMLTGREARRFAQAAKTFGTDINVFQKAQRSFLSAGGVAGAAVVQQKFVTQFRAAGLTANQALTFAAQNANLVAIAGVKYADALARAAANAAKVGVSLDKTEKFADNLVADFEGSLERFSELRAMGVEVDFNRLAQVAGTGTPEEVFNELSAQLGGNKKLLEEVQRNRFLKVALEQDLGLTVDDIKKMAGMAGQPEVETTQEKTNRLLETLNKSLSILAKAVAILGGIIGGFAAGAATGAAFGGPIGAVIGGLIGAGGALAVGDVALGPAAGRMIIGPEGALQLSPRDSIVAGTDLYGEKNKQTKTPAKTAATDTIKSIASDSVQSALIKAAVERGAPLIGNATIRAGVNAIPLVGDVAAGVMVAMDQYKRTGNVQDAISMAAGYMMASSAAGAQAAALAGGTTLAGVVTAPAAPATALAADAIASAAAGELYLKTMRSARGKASGGMIEGPGTPKSDNILTRTSPGEFVVNAASTEKYGADFLNAVNKGTYVPPQPVVNNNVQVDMSKLESKLDKLASAFSAIKIEMDGNTVGRVSLNARSPLDRLSVVG